MKHAFSLVELSIVLVILGLLTGGILAGQSLIRAAELRAVSTEYSRYLAAVQTFRDKYFALPGDMTGATKFWQEVSGVPNTCRTTQGTGTQTCNGDGNGYIEQTTGSDEHHRYWQHLANAGLIEGSYTGIRDGADPLKTTTVNAPKSKLGQGLWFSYNYSIQSGAFDILNGNYFNILELGSPSPTQHPYVPLVKPEEIWNIDTKMDDGKPGLGKLTVRSNPNLNLCTDTNSAADTATAAYLLNSNNVACTFIFRNLY